MKKYCICLLPLILLCCCLGETAQHRQLILAESIIEEHPDSAFHILQSLPLPKNVRNEDQARYALLLNEAAFKLYKPITEDSLLLQSITYYNKVNDDRHLSIAQYYWGVICYEKGKKEEAARALKQAEQLAEKIDDNLLSNKVYESLHMINNDSHNYAVSLDYGRKFLVSSRKLNDSSLVSRAYEHISSSYLRLGQYDSSRIYQEKCLPLMRYLTVNDRAFVCANYASDLIGIQKYDEAMVWLKRALAYKPAANQYVMMGKVFLHKRDTSRAEQYLNQALTFHDTRFTIKASRLLSDIYKQRHDYALAHRYLLMADSLQAQEDSMVLTAQMAKVQTDYDKKTILDKLSSKSLYIMILCILLFFTITAVVFVLWRQKKHDKGIEELLHQIEQKKSRIEELEHERTHSIKEREQEISQLYRQIEQLQQKRTDRLGRGKTIYDQILRREKLHNFTKQKEQDFIDYYAFAFNERFHQATEGYSHLQLRLITFLVLQDMALTDKEITQVLSIADGTVRTYRHRIGKRK